VVGLQGPDLDGQGDGLGEAAPPGQGGGLVGDLDDREPADLLLGLDEEGGVRPAANTRAPAVVRSALTLARSLMMGARNSADGAGPSGWMMLSR
jgi:hypothetical protein